MTKRTLANPSRRKFVVTSAAAGGGLAIGLHVPIGAAATAAKRRAAAPSKSTRGS